MGKLLKAIVGLVIVAGAIIAAPFTGGLSLYLVPVGLSITASAFLGPSVPKVPRTNPADRLYADLQVTTPRKWAFGNTALATDIRYESYTGSGQEYLERIICVASHKVQSIDQIWFDNEKAWDTTGGVQGRYVGYLTVTTRIEGTSANGIAVDATWTTSATLTGCAYVYLRYKLTGNTTKAQSPFASGPTGRVTIRGKGAFTYDPRLDSTVTGGSGAHRASTQSTWTWSDTASRNPALQLLWFLLGWKIDNPTPTGSELITNGAFPTDTAGWSTTTSSTLSAVAGKGRTTSVGANIVNIGQSIAGLIPGKVYRVSIAAFGRGGGYAGGASMLVGTTAAGSQTAIIALSTSVATSFTFVAVASTHYFYAQSDTATAGAGGYIEVDDVSVKGGAGKLALGMGLPPARIDLPSFIAAANICDETVNLNGGGTEPRYRGDGVLSEGDDRTAVIETLCATMNATLRDAGGKIAVSCIKNDLASPVAAFTEADILGEEIWAQTPPLNQSFNIVRGRRIDPSDTALYQPVDFPEVSLTSPDGIDRIDTVEYMLCQSNGQAQRLAKQRLQRNQYQGRYGAVFGPRAWQVTLGDVVTLSHAGLGFSAKLFRVVEQSVARGGPTKMELLEENSAIYAWANDEAAAVSPGTPTVYDPLNDPLVAGIADATLDIGYGPDTHITKYSAAGVAEAGELPYDLNYILYRNGAALTSGVTWTYKVISGGINSKTSANGAQAITGSGTGTLTTSTEESDVSEILLSAVYGSNPAVTKTIVLSKQYAVATGGGSAGGDSPAQTSGFTAIATTSFAVVSNTLTYTVPTGQTTITNTVSLVFRPVKAGGTGNWTVEMKVQRNIASVWTDQGATFSGSTAVNTDPDTGLLVAEAVTLSGTRQSTGLTAGVQYQERIVARLTTGTRSHNITGSTTMVSP